MTDRLRLQLLGLVVLTGAVLYLLSPVLTPFAVAALLGYLGDPLADQLQRRGFSRTTSVVMVFVAMSLVMVLILLLLVPMLEAQISQLIRNLPGYVSWLRSNVEPWLSERFGIEAEGLLDVSGLITVLREHWQTAGGFAATAVASVSKSGLAYWIRQRRVNDKRLNSISSAFAGSSEFQRRYGSLTNRQFVELVYQNVLGRPGEASGVNFWTSRLDRRVASRGEVMTGFSESNEYKTKQASEVEVAVQYLLMLGTIPSASAFDDLVAQLDAGTLTPATLAQAIIDSPGYATKITG